jgi:hypothetical protein
MQEKNPKINTLSHRAVLKLGVAKCPKRVAKFETEEKLGFICSKQAKIEL